MSRGPAVHAARGFTAGALRAAAPGDRLCCLVLVGGREWVAVDTNTGAYVRPYAPEDPGQPADPAMARPLELVELTIGGVPGPPDPSRPEAVSPAGSRSLGPSRRRAARRLLARLVTKAPELPLLGTLGPSVAYRDLDGGRPSVVLVSPDDRPRFGNGPSGPWCQFTLGGRRHALPLNGRPEEALEHAEGRGHPGTSRRGSRGAGRGSAQPRLLLVGYGAPRGGQVPKIVLGALS
ncbi:MAG: hypothetical protein ACRDZ6_10720 [Acidimicrobiales bacterium]